MVNDAALWSLGIAIFSLSVAVCSVLVCWRTGTRCTRALKSLRGLVLTQTSDAKLSRALADQAELFSTLERLTTTVKRLSSRAGMQDVRARGSQEGEPPPVGTSKAELRRHYGLVGKSAPEIARAQFSMVPNNSEE